MSPEIFYQERRIGGGKNEMSLLFFSKVVVATNGLSTII